MNPRSITAFDPTKKRSVPGGRLTPESLTPVLTIDKLSFTETFWTPYLTDILSLYNGISWKERQFTELSNITTNSVTGNAGPAAVVANSNYDLFVWEDAAGDLFLTRGPVWTSDILRSAGTALVVVEGTELNAVSITNGPAAQRGLYVGSIRSGAGAVLFWKFGGKAVGGSSGYFNVWNRYNRIWFSAESRESTVSWTYAGGAGIWRAINNALNNRVSYIVGLAEDEVEALYHSHVNVGPGGVPYVGVGLDSVLVRWGSSTFHATAGFGNIHGMARVNQLGFHFLQAIEFNNAAGGLPIFYGDIGIPLIAQNGLFFRGKF